MAPRTTACAVPLPMSLEHALDASQPLAQLKARWTESSARFEAIRPALPPDLQRCVEPGVLDATGWTLVVPHAAAAAKLRQWCPLLVQQLAERGWQSTPIRVRVQRP
jgi:hypothetical protein